MGLGRLGFASGLGHMGPASCAILGRLTETGFWCIGLVSVIGYHHSVRFGGSRPGRGARIPRAVLTGEAGLLVGYGGCGCPGPGLGHAESLSGVP